LPKIKTFIEIEIECGLKKALSDLQKKKKIYKKPINGSWTTILEYIDFFPSLELGHSIWIVRFRGRKLIEDWNRTVRR
jgi:hypothetical protein